MTREPPTQRRGRPAHGAGKLLLCVLWVGMLGCRAGGCGGHSLQAEVDGQRFVRCAQAEPPSAGAVQVGRLSLTIEGRSLRIEGATDLRIAAFTGPAGGRLEPSELAALQRARPGLVFYLGGLGDDEATARQNLASLAALHVPALFVAGGADRLPVVEAAFASLADGERDRLLHASGLREVWVGPERFVIAAGAALGRYTLDEQSCGLTSDDLAEIQGSPGAGRTWLLSWHAPTGFGVSTGFAGSEVGSPDVQGLARAIGAQGGLFAYPETQVGLARSPGLSLVVPRLSSVGSQRADGSRLAGQVATLVFTAEGLVPGP